MKKLPDKKWLTSKETKSLLKISDCKLMHLRLAGKIEFKKVGKAYLYLINSEYEKER
jgi:hypothetical protein